MGFKVRKMNIRSLYWLAWDIESILKDIVNQEVNDETEKIELLLDAKRLSDMLSLELNDYIKRVVK
jgi:hypothetical protein